MKNIILISLLIVLSSFKVLAQTQLTEAPIIPPSPEASSLLKYAQIPVNHYTGTASINLPIYNFESRNKYFSVPVGISYHPSGVKVHDMASSVGLGWKLNAGGAITRVVRGLPDEHEEGYVGTNLRGQQLLNGPVDDNYLKKVAANLWDGEPDVFYFSMNGIAGRFFIDPYGTPFTVPGSDFEISPAIGPKSTETYWTITLDNGTKYFFGKGSNTTETTESFQSNDSPCPGAPDPETTTFISTWYLSEISFYNEKVELEYQTGDPIEYEVSSEKKLVIEEEVIPEPGCYPSVPICSDQIVKFFTSVKITNPKSIKKISNDSGYLLFGNKAGRNDLTGGLYLDNIKLVSYAGTEISEYKFNYDYFDSGCGTWKCKRLRLKSFGQVPNGSNNSEIAVPYTFEYDATPLESRDTKKIDHWGYQNSNTKNYLIPTIATYFTNGADRSASLSGSKAGSLTKIIYPTGGYRSFDYELNSYLEDNTNHNAGGIRIKNIIENFGPGTTDITFNFEYKLESGKSSGTRINTPVYLHPFASLNSSDPFNNNEWDCRVTGQILHSSSLTERFDPNGYHVGYSRVVANYGDGSKEVFSYHSFSDKPDFIDLNDYHDDDGNLIDPNGPPYAPPSRSYFFERGLLKESNTYSSNGNLLKTVKNNYSKFIKFEDLIAPGLRSILRVTDNIYGLQLIYIGEYAEENNATYLNSTVETIYDPNDESKKLTKTTNYVRKSDSYSLARNTSITHNSGVSSKTDFTYITDIQDMASPSIAGVYADGYWRMATNRMTGIPIETVHYARNSSNESYKIVGSELFTWKRATHFESNTDGNGYSLPYQKLSLSIAEPITDSEFSPVTLNTNGTTLFWDSKYEAIHTFDDYNNNGNLIKEINSAGIETSYSWSHNNFLVSSQLSNSFQSSYDQIPFVGLSKLTDQNGRFSNFNYDKLNRMKYATDEEGNIKEVHRYNFGTNPEQITAVYDISGKNKSGESLTFEFTGNDPMYGENRYIWDFGDGTILESSSKSVQHTYASADGYSTSLTIINSEYEETPQQILPITIFDTPLSFSISSTGEPETGYNVSAAGTLGYTCGNLSYNWKYGISGSGNWLDLNADGQHIQVSVPSDVTWQIKLEVVDDCNETITSNIIYLIGPEPDGSNPVEQ